MKLSYSKPIIRKMLTVSSASVIAGSQTEVYGMRNHGSIGSNESSGRRGTYGNLWDDKDE